MPGHSRLKDAYDPGIHVLLSLDKKAWMAGSSCAKTHFCPAMTKNVPHFSTALQRAPNLE